MNSVLRSWPVRALAVLAGILLFAAIAGQLRTAEEPARLSAAERSGTAVRSGDGDYLVGRELAPGTYRTPGATAGEYCMWERRSGASGRATEILAAQGAYSGPLVVTIEPTDVLFRTRGCHTFERIG